MPGEFEDLLLAAKASDRAKAADQEWPALEERLRQLGLLGNDGSSQCNGNHAVAQRAKPPSCGAGFDVFEQRVRVPGQGDRRSVWLSTGDGV
jgi:hypothetical protein